MQVQQNHFNRLLEEIPFSEREINRGLKEVFFYLANEIVVGAKIYREERGKFHYDPRYDTQETIITIDEPFIGLSQGEEKVSLTREQEDRLRDTLTELLSNN